MTWAYIFFWCAALSVALSFWRAVRSTPPPVAHLGPETILTVAMLGLYIAGALGTVRRLQTLSLPAARRSVLMLAGVGLLLASMLLRLR